MNKEIIKYDLASPADAEEIALLHALSWQRHYRNIYSENYLQYQVVEERRKIWQERFSKENEDRMIIKVMDLDKIIGFACTFLDEDPTYGALVDNLHVLSEYQGNGIGKKLLNKSSEWVMQCRNDYGIYLYVLAKNYPACAFYKNLGAKMSEPFLYKNPTGTEDDVIRCSWQATELFQRTG